MQRWLALLVVVAGCYAPTPPSGAPCTNGLCPEGLACVDELCVAPGGDAAAPDAPSDDAPEPDGAPAPDRDNDSIADEADNCPDLANANQRNHDADSAGDACDPCPHLAGTDTDIDLDTDQDGIGDGCDPRPSDARESLAMFEGFYDGIPPGWISSGSVTGEPGQIIVDLPSGNRASLSSPEPALNSAVLVGQVTPLAYRPPDGGGIGIVLPITANSTTGPGVACQLIYLTPEIPALAILAVEASMFVESTPYPFQLGTSYRLTLTRKIDTYECEVVGPQGTMSITTPITGEMPASPRFGVRARGMEGTFDYLLLIDTD